MLEKVDYCFIGKIRNFKDVDIYENGKIKTLMSISIESTIKGDVTGDIEIYRDGGISWFNEYVNYPKDTCLDKNKLKEFNDLEVDMIELRIDFYENIHQEDAFRNLFLNIAALQIQKPVIPRLNGKNTKKVSSSCF